MSVHLEFVGTGARATPPAGGAVSRLIPLTVVLKRLVLRTSRPRSVGQRSDFTNNFEMHRAGSLDWQTARASLPALDAANQS